MPSRNNKLGLILFSIDYFCKVEFNKEITITSIYRTPEENQAAGATSAIHVYWGGADIRTHDFTNEECQKIVDFANQFTYPRSKGKKVAMRHSVTGGADHIHIQY